AIALDKKDTIYFDLGWHSNDLKEREPYVIVDGKVYLMNIHKSTHNDTYFDYIGEADSVDTNKFLKNVYSYDTVDNRSAKIVTPKVIRNGMTGIYIDSLWQSGSSKDRFNLCGIDLSYTNLILFLKAIKTLKFRKSK